MVQILVYNTNHWFDNLPLSEQIALNIDGKFNSRYVRGDIIEVRPDYFWFDKFGNKLAGFRLDVFMVIQVRDMTIEEGKALQQQVTHEEGLNIADLLLKSRYRIPLENFTIPEDHFIKVNKNIDGIIDKTLL